MAKGNVKPIPDGYPRAMPYLIVDGAAKALDFYKQVFEAKERMRMPAPQGKVGHAEITIGDSVIMLADEHPEMDARAPRAFGGSPVSLMVYVARCRRHREDRGGRGSEGRPPHRGHVLRRPDRHHRGPVRAPLARRHPHRGRLPRRNGAPRRRDHGEARLAGLVAAFGSGETGVPGRRQPCRSRRISRAAL